MLTFRKFNILVSKCEDWSPERICDEYDIEIGEALLVSRTIGDLQVLEIENPDELELYLQKQLYGSHEIEGIVAPNTVSSLEEFSEFLLNSLSDTKYMLSTYKASKELLLGVRAGLEAQLETVKNKLREIEGE